MKTQIITAAFIISASLLAAQENKTSTTVRIKKTENMNGKERTSDTTYTVNGPVTISDIDKDGMKDGEGKKMIIITDKITGDEKELTVGSAGEIVDEQVAKALKDAGIDSKDIEKTVIVNVDKNNADGKKKKMVKVVIIKNIKILDPTSADTKLLSKSTAVADNKLAVGRMDFYPNPNTGKFNLRFTLGDKGATSITVLSTEGKTIYSEQLADFTGTYDKEIDISQNPKGIYFVKITQGTHAQLKKIVLE